MYKVGTILLLNSTMKGKNNYEEREATLFTFRYVLRTRKYVSERPIQKGE